MARGEFDKTSAEDLAAALWSVQFDAVEGFVKGDVVPGSEFRDVRYLANVGAVSKAPPKAKRFVRREASSPSALETKIAELEQALAEKPGGPKELKDALARVKELEAEAEALGSRIALLVGALAGAGVPLPEGYPVEELPAKA